MDDEDIRTLLETLSLNQIQSIKNAILKLLEEEQQKAVSKN